MKTLNLGMFVFLIASACEALAQPSTRGLATTNEKYACGNVIDADNGDFSFKSICMSEKHAVVRVGTFEGHTYFYNIQVDQELKNKKIYSLVPDVSRQQGEVGRGLSVILKVKPNYTITTLVKALTDPNVTLDGAGGRVWVIGNPSPQSEDDQSYVVDGFKLSSP